MSNSKRLNVKALSLWYGISAIVIVLDQITKLWADKAFQNSEWVITPFFKFSLAYNTGAAFSILHWADGWQRWLFAVIAVVVSVAIAVAIAMAVKKQVPGRHWELGGFALVLGGAIGNLIDRLAYGHVIDFITVHYQDNYFPTFNVADSAICVGAALIIFDVLFIQSRSGNGNQPETSENDKGADQADSHV